MLDSSPDFPVVEISKPTLDDLYMTAQEVADRLRVDPQTLANLRARGEGIPYNRVTGRVLYKVADVLAAEAAGARGFSRTRLATALDTFPGITKTQRERLLLHITEALKG